MNDSVTYSKAIGIIFMVLCHAIYKDIWHIDSFVAMFHMPIFFIFSGYCLKEHYFSNPFVFFKKKLIGIYIPYVKYSLFFLFLHNIFFWVLVFFILISPVVPISQWVKLWSGCII